MKARETKKRVDVMVQKDATKETCFVISPIGKEGTETYEKFKEVLDYIIKPAFKNSGYKIDVIRADDIKRAGSFIKDIFSYILNSFVVIADLTDNNANVFYELGVRHSLRSRTILIAQSVDDIPSDLREYRTIIYDSSAKGLATFQEQLSAFLEEIYKEPNRPDNPVLDRIGSEVERKHADLIQENANLREQITLLMKKGGSVDKTEISSSGEEVTAKRINRIIEIEGLVRQHAWDLGGHNGSVVFTKKEGKITVAYPDEQGDFKLYFKQEDNTIWKATYIATLNRVVYEHQMADVRVLVGKCAKKNYELSCEFIIATNQDLTTAKEAIEQGFKKMKDFIKPEYRDLFSILIWDKQGLLNKEKELGLKIQDLK